MYVCMYICIYRERDVYTYIGHAPSDSGNSRSTSSGPWTVGPAAIFREARQAASEYVYIYIYIYIERERCNKYKYAYVYAYVYVCVCVCVCV